MQRNYRIISVLSNNGKAFFLLNELFYFLINNEKAYIIDVSCVLRRL